MSLSFSASSRTTAATNIVMAINVVRMVQKRSVQVRSVCGTGNC